MVFFKFFIAEDPHQISNEEIDQSGFTACVIDIQFQDATNIHLRWDSIPTRNKVARDLYTLPLL